MTEDEIKAAAEKKEAEDSAKELAKDNAKSELDKKSVGELAELVRSTRSEAKERRLKERELEEQIANMKAAQKKVEEDKLLADGKTQELLDNKIIELSNTQKELATAKVEAEESKAFKASKVEAYEKQMGNDWNPDFANLSLTALDKLVTMTKGKVSINTDNGSNGKHTKIELTDDQKRDAIAKYPHIPKDEAYEYHIDNLITEGKIKKE